MRFTIRDLLWLTVVVAILFAWKAHSNHYMGNYGIILWHSDESVSGLNVGDRVILEVEPDGRTSRKVLRAKDVKDKG